jgi:phage/plasmid-like protein (TIGR03299 family)
MRSNNTSRSFFRGLGVEVQEGATVDEQITAARLDWTVETGTIYYGNGKATDDHRIAYRSDTQAPLSIYGKSRQPFQNRQILETFNAFCDANNLQINRVGSMNGGKNIFAFTKLPIAIDTKNVGDITEAHLLINESHECGNGLQIDLFLNRLVCTNGMTRSVTQGATIGHTSVFNPTKVTQYLVKALAQVNEYKETTEHLAEISMSRYEAEMHLIKAFGDPSKTFDEQPAIVRTCYKLFMGEGKGSNYLSAYNTAYGLLESVKEYINWHSPTRGSVEASFSSLCYGSRKSKQDSFMKQLVSVHF